MSSTGIDFVINGDDNATPVIAALDNAVEKLMGSMKKMQSQASQERKFEAVLQRQMKAVESATKEEEKYNDILKKQMAAFDKVAQKTLKNAGALGQHTRATKQAERGTRSLKTATDALMSSLGPLLAIVAVVKTAMAAVGGVNAAKEAFDAQTEAVKRLNSALNIRGAGAATAQMQAFGKQMEAVTGISATAVNQLQAQALAMGIATDRVDDATKASLGLAEATGKTAEASLGDLTAALQGNFAAFEGLNPQIKFMATNQQKLNAVMAIANEGLNMHGNSLNTVEGSGRRANTAMQNFLEVVGKIMEPVRILVNTGLQQLWSSLQTLVMPAVQKASKMMANLGPIMDKVRKAIVTAINVMIAAFTWFETMLTNFGTVWDFWKTAADLAMTNVAETVRYYTTEVIPQYLKWFTENVPNFFNDAFTNALMVVTNAGQKIGDTVMAYLVIALNAGEYFAENFKEFIADAFNGALTVIKNGGDAMGTMFSQIWAFIKAGGKGGISKLMSDLGETASGDLLKGFEASAKTKAPDFAAEFETIAKGAGEGLKKGFQNTVGDLPDIVGRQLTAKEQDLIDRLKGLGGKLGDEFSKKLKERLLNVGDTLNAEMTDSVKNMSLLARPQAVMQGSQASEGRLLTRGPASDIPQQMLEQLRRIYAKTSKTAEASEENVKESRENKEATNQVAANTTSTLQLVMTT